MLSGTASQGKEEEGLAGAALHQYLPCLQDQTWGCIPSAGEHSSSDAPAKIPLGGQTEPKVCHQQWEEMLKWLWLGEMLRGRGGCLPAQLPVCRERLQCNAACTLQGCRAASQGDLQWSALHGEILQLCYCHILVQNFLELEV